MEKVRIAVIGTGSIGPRHAKSIVACNEAELLCLVDPDPRATTTAKLFNVPLFDSVDRMAEKGYRPEAAIVCTPNNTHVTISKALLNKGIHVLVEKPISIDVSSAQELLDAATASGRTLLVGHHRRFNPYVAATKRALAEGAIGMPVAVSGLWTQYKPPTYFEPPAEWRKVPGSGGPLLINMIHEADILQYILGPIVRVHAEQTKPYRGFEVEEGAAILLRFASGVVGTFIISDAVPSVHNWESATGENPIVPQASQDCYRVFGTDGTLSVGDMKLTTYGAGVERSWESRLEERELPVGDDVPFDEQIRHLVRVLRNGEPPRCTGEDGLRALMVCDAIKRALAQGGPVDVTSV